MVLVVALLLQTAQPSPAALPPPPPPLHGGPQEMTCPVGGERFSAWRPSSYSIFGERPDGKPYSYLPFPFPVPECPTNKLIVFDDFSPEETATLARLIAAEDYKRLTEAETPYYRAYWLAMKLGRPKPQALGLLLSAIWQVSPGQMAGKPSQNDAAQLDRYQKAFVNEARQLEPAVEAKDRVWIEARAANAARQMGQFDEAERLRQQAEKSLAAIADKRGWDTYLAKLQAVISRRDAEVEPVDMIPEQQIAYACLDRRTLNAFDRAACGKPEVAAAVAKLRKSQREQAR
jgi:hypothetical protein